MTAQPEKFIGQNFLLVSYRNYVDDIIGRFATSGPIERITIFLGPPIRAGGEPLTRIYQVRLLGDFKGYR